MNIAVILLSGKGKRLGGDIPKQFILVNDRPIYIYSLDAFYKNKRIDRILLVTNEEHIARVKSDVRKYGYTKKPIRVVAGGSERYLSVMKAIEELKGCDQDDLVLIHDGVRPNVSQRIINENIQALIEKPCVLTAIKSDNNIPVERVDTVHIINNQFYRAQTPQSFKLEVLRDIYKKAGSLKPFPFTDDISIAIVYKYPVFIVRGEDDNYKITRPDDLERFKKEKQ